MAFRAPHDAVGFSGGSTIARLAYSPVTPPPWIGLDRFAKECGVEWSFRLLLKSQPVNKKNGLSARFLERSCQRIGWPGACEDGVLNCLSSLAASRLGTPLGWMTPEAALRATVGRILVFQLDGSFQLRPSPPPSQGYTPERFVGTVRGAWRMILGEQRVSRHPEAVVIAAAALRLSGRRGRSSGLALRSPGGSGRPASPSSP
jgi:hypothetical protein